MADQKLTLEVELILAEMRDFTHYMGSLNPSQKNVGMPFIVLNAAGKPELYRLGPNSDLGRIAFMIEQDRVYIFKQCKEQ
jgi:hypothetical protein